LIFRRLLDFLFELERNGLKTPLTIAGGFGLFLKRRYLTERKDRTLFNDITSTRATEDIDIVICTAQVIAAELFSSERGVRRLCNDKNRPFRVVGFFARPSNPTSQDKFE
jgi:hypothetical protein